MKFLHTGHRAFSFSVLTSSFSLNQKHFASSLQFFVLSCSLSSILVFRAPQSGKLKKRKQAAYQSLLMQMEKKKIRGRRPWHTGCIILLCKEKKNCFGRCIFQQNANIILRKGTLLFFLERGWFLSELFHCEQRHRPIIMLVSTTTLSIDTDRLIICVSPSRQVSFDTPTQIIKKKARSWRQHKAKYNGWTSLVAASLPLKPSSYCAIFGPSLTKNDQSWWYQPAINLCQKFRRIISQCDCCYAVRLLTNQ